ncbi:MAG: dihydroorotase [Rhizobiaceae bacterium]|nr:dihydroorotase [Rhizobiaceae bacterium]
MTKRLEILMPDDWHLHLRDGEMLKVVTPISARYFARAIIMPNLVPPVTTLRDAEAYRQRILAALPAQPDFQPLMTLYLTEDTKAQEVEKAHLSGIVKAVKLYPAGATTNSQSGVRDFDKIIPVLEKMAELEMPLCVHGEVSDHDVDIFDREAVFIEQVLEPLRVQVPMLKVVLEHVTTADGIDYIRRGGDNIAGTITTHHLIINRNHILAGGIRPHYYCLPVAKRERHRLALVQAATSGEKQFFLGTDSAPHIDAAKLSPCGCAGIFTALNTMGCLAHVFEEADALPNLEYFTSRNGPNFYNLPLNSRTIVLEKSENPLALPATIKTPIGQVTVFDPGFNQHWYVA